MKMKSFSSGPPINDHFLLNFNPKICQYFLGHILFLSGQMHRGSEWERRTWENLDFCLPNDWKLQNISRQLAHAHSRSLSLYETI